jgi:hypothetical protein
MLDGAQRLHAVLPVPSRSVKTLSPDSGMGMNRYVNIRRDRR